MSFSAEDIEAMLKEYSHINNKEIELGFMYGFIKNDESKAVVSNRIFETYLYNLFIDEEIIKNLVQHQQ